MDVALEGLKPLVTEDINDQLTQQFAAEEIIKALTQMCPTKALEPDGLPAILFQKQWQSMKVWVLLTCLYVLNNQGNIAPLNHNCIALIPKVVKPRKVTDFRLISLCNVIYRIVTKTIANKLKPILAQIISPT